MDYHIQLALARAAKFLALLVYAAGVGVGLTQREVALRKYAIHLWASPALIGVWLSGYVLTLFSGVALTELWVSTSFFFSLAAQLAMTRSARSPQVKPGHRWVVCGLLTVTVCLMVLRPTWWSLAG